MAHNSAVNHQSLGCSAVEMKAQTIPSLAAILTLPQEIRDQIYNYLLTSTYRVNLTPIKITKETVTDLFRDFARKSFALQHYGQYIIPEPHSPQRNTTFGAARSLDGKDALAQRLPIAPIYSFPPTSSRPREQQASIATTLLFRNTSKPISNRLSILLTSKAVRQDAIAILFKESYFRYVIASPGHDTTPTEIKNQMQNIEICFSITFPVMGFPEEVLATGRSVLRSFCGEGIRRRKMIVHVFHCRNYTLLMELADSLGALTGFGTLELRLGSFVRRTRSEGDGGMPALVIGNDEECVEVYCDLCRILTAKLGAFEMMGGADGWFWAVFHPRRYVESIAKVAGRRMGSE